MSFLDKNLMSDETLVYRARPHWIIFWPAGFWFVVSLFIYIFAQQQPLFSTPFMLHLIMLLGRLALILAALSFCISLINYATSEYGLTTKRVLMKTGFFRIISLDIRLSRVESIEVQQTLIGQLFNFGFIVISGVGGSKDPFRNIPSPQIFRQKIQQSLEMQPVSRDK